MITDGMEDSVIPARKRGRPKGSTVKKKKPRLKCPIDMTREQIADNRPLSQEFDLIEELTDCEGLLYRRAKGFILPVSVLHPCICGGIPVIARYIYGDDHDLIVHCPECDRRVHDTGSFNLVRKEWNFQYYSDDSEMINHPLTYIDDEGLIALCYEIFQHKDEKKQGASKHPA